jgi:Cu/Zn superoxide dismutase
MLMKSLSAITIGTALAIALTGSALAQTQMNSAGASVTVPMHAQNGSGEDGTATLTQKDADVVVAIDLKNGTATPQPAHVHVGPCSKLGGVKYPLTNVVNGKSESTLKGIKLSDLQSGDLAINVHKSADDLATYVSCGDIPKS